MLDAIILLFPCHKFQTEQIGVKKSIDSFFVQCSVLITSHNSDSKIFDKFFIRGFCLLLVIAKIVRNIKQFRERKKQLNFNTNYRINWNRNNIKKITVLLICCIVFVLFTVVRVDMWVHFVSIWIHVIQIQDHDVKMVAFVKLITQMQCLRLNVDAQLDLQLRCVKSQKEMPVTRDHVKMVVLVIWNHFRSMCAHVHKATPVSYQIF